MCVHMSLVIQTAVWSEMQLCGRASARGMMVRWIEPSWWTHWAISRCRQCTMTGLTNIVVCAFRSS